MTRKENLYVDYMIAKDEYWSYHYDFKREYPDRESAIEAFKRHGVFCRDCRKTTIDSLKNEIAYYTAQVDELKRAKAVESWYATDAGKEYRSAIMRELHALEAKSVEIRNKNHIAMNALLSKRLGKGFKVKSLSPRWGEVVLCDADGKNIFGHDFSVNVEKDNKTGQLYVRVNYPSLGSFALDNVNRVKYLEGLAKFAGNVGNVADDYVGMVIKFDAELEEIRDKVCKLNHNLKYPEMVSKTDEV
ncbi:MAG: hypothetical protein J6Y37_00320 [Paludibacteraceae bacterium]|nr:hypothetical protein [Paludibacteraceae bacterium]